MTLPSRSLHAILFAPFCVYEVGSGQPPQGKLIRGQAELLPPEGEKRIGGGGEGQGASPIVHTSGTIILAFVCGRYHTRRATSGGEAMCYIRARLWLWEGRGSRREGGQRRLQGALNV